MIRPTAALIAALVLAGCDTPLLREPPPPLGDRLVGDQISSTLAGNSLVRGDDEVPPLVVYFEANGVMRGIRSNNYTDTGTWKVEDDALCGAWNNWAGTLARCWEVYRAGGALTLKRTDHGAVFRAALASGDVAHLK